MTSSKYIVRADNPKGLPYAWATNDSDQVKLWVIELVSKGATDIKVNGNLVTQDIIDAIS